MAIDEPAKAVAGGRFWRRPEFIFLAALMLTLGMLWCLAVFGTPLSFWSAQRDWPVMPLAEAINIDFWLREPGPRALSQAQFYQPGMWFQLTSYGLYRLVSGNESPVALFERIIRDPACYWMVLQTAPLLLTYAALALLWRQTATLSPLARCAALAVYFVTAAAMTYALWGFFNESFTFLLAVMFFPPALNLLREHRPRPILTSLALGLAASALYLHKMNYVVWALSLVPALFVAAWAGRMSWAGAALRTANLIIGLVVGVLVAGYLFLGKVGVRLMLDSHLQIALGSGIYGNGEKTVVSLSTIVVNAIAMAKAEPFMLIVLGLVVALAAWLALSRRTDRAWLGQHLPEGLFLLTAAGAMLLALFKHYQPYYVVSIAAVFPFLVIWLARAGSRRGLVAVLLVSIVGLGAGAYTTGLMRQEWATAEARMKADDEVIASRPSPPGSVRLWMYLTHNDIAGRLFLLSFTGLDRLLGNVAAAQGPNYFTSPWHTSIAMPDGSHDLKAIRWQSIVVDKEWLPWINRSLHTWIDDPRVKRTELRQVVLFEKQPNAE